MTSCTIFETFLALRADGRLGVEEAAILQSHLDVCSDCRAVVTELGGDKRSEDTSNRCLRFEALLALRADGKILTDEGGSLEEHLASCRACAEVAQTMGSATESGIDFGSLPEIPREAYTFGDEIARGGMGRIRSARDLRIGRQVAVKELFDSSPELMARFEREARMTARLQHPNIVPIYEIGRWSDGNPFYAMRNVPGRTLRDAMKDAKNLSERMRLLPSVIAAAEAVAYAHRMRIIHRDVTPANVLVGAHGETVVIDWGLAKDLSEAAATDIDLGTYRSSVIEPNLTVLGAVIGTPAYMPPEQARGEPVDERADVYALGAVLYHLLGGSPPYHGGNGHAILRRLVDEHPPPLVELEPATPRDLLSIVTRAMARSAGERYPTAREFADELTRFQTGRLVQTHAYTFGELVSRWVRRNRTTVIASAIALLIIAVGTVVAATRNVQQREAAEATAATLLEEQGRQELLAGNSQRALPYLARAYQHSPVSPSLRFLLAAALRDVEPPERVLERRPGLVKRLEYSADGGRLLVVTEDAIEVWTIAEGLLAVDIRSERGFADGHFSTDGSLILSRDRGETRAELWDAATGRRKCTFRGHVDRVTSAAMTPDHTKVVTTSLDGTWRVWDADTCESLLRARSDKAIVHGSVDPLGRYLVALDWLGIGTVWNLITAERISETWHDGYQPNTVIGPDGQLVATCGFARENIFAGVTILWNPNNGQVLKKLFRTAEGPSAMVSCGFDREGKRLATAYSTGSAKVWDVATGEALISVVHGKGLHGAIFSPDGTLLLTTGLDGLIRMWLTDRGALLATYQGSRAEAVAFSPDSTHFAMSDNLGQIGLRTSSAGKRRRVFGLPGDGERWLDYGLDGTRQMTLRGTAVALWDATTGKQMINAPIQLPARFSKDRRRIVAAAKRDKVVVLDASSGATISTLQAKTATLRHLELSADGGRVLIVNEGEAPRLLETLSGRLLLTMDGATEASSLDDSGRHVLGWTTAGPIQIWDVDSKQVLATLEVVPNADTNDTAITGDGSHVVVILRAINDPAKGPGDLVALYEVRSGRRLVTIPRANAASFDAAGETMATFGDEVRLWRVADGAPISTLAIDQPGAGSLFGALSPNGAFVIVGRTYTVSVDLYGVTDGRLLMRYPTVYWESFGPARAVPVFGLDDSLMFMDKGQLEAWALDRETRPAVEVAQLVEKHNPWRLEGSQVVPSEGTLRLRVVVGQGRPIPQAIATVRHANEPHDNTIPWAADESQQLITTTDGLVTFSHLKPGPYDLTVFDAQVGGLTPQKRIWITADKILDLTIALDRHTSISGTVTSPEGQAASGVVLEFSSATGSIVRATTSSAGKFEAMNLADRCVYDVVVRSPESQTHELVTTNGEPATVRVDDSPVDDVRLVLRRQK